METSSSSLKKVDSKKSNKRPIMIDESGDESSAEEDEEASSQYSSKRKKRKDVEEIKSFIIDSKKKGPNDQTWKQIVGLESVIECIREATILPQKFPQLFVGERRPWRAILLYTLLASTLASESEATFFSVSSADLLSKWVGQSEKKIKQLFEFAASRKPSIIFIDEIDSLCSARNDTDSETSRRIKTEFLVQMQGIGSRDGVTVIGATNLPWDIDSAIRRRFEKRIYVPLPTQESRREIIKHNLRNTPNSLIEENFQKIAELTDGYSGSDLSVVIRQAIMEPLRKCQQATHFRLISGYSPITGIERNDLLEPVFENIEQFDTVQISLYDISPEKLLPPLVSFEDFEKALNIIHPTLSREDVAKYQEFSKIF
ncbi:predicted protein [Naegleria gruberi]|uniref:Predicted protein n=1 Tax=Naegleria gruberi TaxID=5762 RepID=D2VMJ6_NAEGR|nr:uncharacterized protein NAEGRDRAFT_44667 [Naegleria gruberi]EFC41998.1 predicted protein [Naegleria gruberi]|eukprot:XP_002674742.1 predicted protein [Naegleria gruberi strain NEG-M]